MTAVLFARQDSIYKSLDCDVWDIDRDALRWPGGCPIVAHPPCRAWGRLRAFARPRPNERWLALWSIKQVRRWGGVVEHPASSLLWSVASIAPVGKHDTFGGYLLWVSQWWFGHKADKPTLLYIVGCEPGNLPPMPYRMGNPEYVVSTSRGNTGKKEIKKSEREHTPLELAIWLLETAKRCDYGKPELA